MAIERTSRTLWEFIGVLMALWMLAATPFLYIQQRDSVARSDTIYYDTCFDGFTKYSSFDPSDLIFCHAGLKDKKEHDNDTRLGSLFISLLFAFAVTVPVLIGGVVIDWLRFTVLTWRRRQDSVAE